MPGSLNIGQQGLLKSSPSKVSMRADDNYKIVYKNVGKDRNVPIMWSTYHVLTSGADVIVASGVSFYGMDLVSYASMTATVVSGTPDGYIYFSKNVTQNIITICSTGSATVGVDVTWLLGQDPTAAIL